MTSTYGARPGPGEGDPDGSGDPGSPGSPANPDSAGSPDRESGHDVATSPDEVATSPDEYDVLALVSTLPEQVADWLLESIAAVAGGPPDGREAGGGGIPSAGAATAAAAAVGATTAGAPTVGAASAGATTAGAASVGTSRLTGPTTVVAGGPDPVEDPELARKSAGELIRAAQGIQAWAESVEIEGVRRLLAAVEADYNLDLGQHDPPSRRTTRCGLARTAVVTELQAITGLPLSQCRDRASLAAAPASRAGYLRARVASGTTSLYRATTVLKETEHLDPFTADEIARRALRPIDGKATKSSDPQAGGHRSFPRYAPAPTAGQSPPSGSGEVAGAHADAPDAPDAGDAVDAGDEGDEGDEGETNRTNPDLDAPGVAAPDPAASDPAAEPGLLLPGTGAENLLFPTGPDGLLAGAGRPQTYEPQRGTAETARVPDGFASETAALTELGNVSQQTFRRRLARDVSSAARPEIDAERVRAKARAARELHAEPAEHGMGRLDLSAEADRVFAAHERIDRLARRARAQGDRRNLAQLRSDIATDLLVHGTVPDDQLLGDAPPGRVHVVVCLSTLLGLDQLPAEIPGAGLLTAAQARRVALRAGSTWRRIVTDPVTGTAIDASRSYRPTQAMREQVLARDRTCRAPGCEIVARGADLDHVREWHRDARRPADGATHPDNLISLHRGHHNPKTRRWWMVRSGPAGALTWKTLTGREITTHPASYHDLTERVPGDDVSFLEARGARYLEELANPLPLTREEAALREHLMARRRPR